MKLPFSSLTSVLRMLTMYLLRSCNEEPLYETIIWVGSPGFVCKKNSDISKIKKLLLQKDIFTETKVECALVYQLSIF